ncbi:hypothetical protein MHU86_8735 [Fragilaria crotonensis]|nr:hypothetical protein MHU86_8735 [Fragilaria crotonensis]
MKLYKIRVTNRNGAVGDDNNNNNDKNTTATNTNSDEDGPSLAELGSVAVLTGLVGSLLLGPLVGLGVAVGAACVAMTDTPPGKVTRQAGSSIVQTKQQIQEYESKHQVLQKSRDGIVQGCTVVSEKMKACAGKGDQVVA